MNEISLILIIFVLLLILSSVINKKTKNITITDITNDEIKNIISKMCELLNSNQNILKWFLSTIECINEGSDLVESAYEYSQKLFFESNEENFIEYRNLETKLFAIINETKLNDKDYSKIFNACSAGAFCFDEMREMFITTSAYFLFKDEARLNIITQTAIEIYTAHQTSQYLRKFLE